MKKRFILLPLLIAALLSLGVDECEMVGFGGGTIPVNVTINETFNINSTTTSYSDAGTQNMQQVYSDAGINTSDVTGANMTNCEITISAVDIPAGTLVSGTVNFKLVSETSWKQLATFTNQNLNTLITEGATLDPWDDITPRLVLNETNVALLNVLLDPTQTNPPPNLNFQFTGTATNTGIQFNAELDILIQVWTQTD